MFVVDERLVKLGPSNVPFDEARHRCDAKSASLMGEASTSEETKAAAIAITIITTNERDDRRGVVRPDERDEWMDGRFIYHRTAGVTATTRAWRRVGSRNSSP